MTSKVHNFTVFGGRKGKKDSSVLALDNFLDLLVAFVLETEKGYKEAT